MTIKLPKVNTLLYWGIFLMIIKVSFSSSRILPYSDMMDNVLSIVSATLLSLFIISEKYSIKILLVYACIAVVSAYSVSKTGNYGFLVTILTCMAIRNENMEKVISFIFRYEALFFVLHTIYAISINVMFDQSIVSNIYGVERVDLGFWHPNTFSIYLFNLIIMWIWLNFTSISYKNMFVILGICICSYFLTKTRTSFINALLLILLLIIYKKAKNFAVVLERIAKYIVLVINVCTIILVKGYAQGNVIVYSIDMLLSGRIRLGAYAYERFGVTLLGQDLSSIVVEWDSVWQLTGHTFDNLFSFLLINQGIMWSVILTWAFYKLAKLHNVRTNIFIIMWALYGVTEVHGVNGYKFFPILLLVYLLRNDEVK